MYDALAARDDSLDSAVAIQHELGAIRHEAQIEQSTTGGVFIAQIEPMGRDSPEPEALECEANLTALGYARQVLEEPVHLPLLDTEHEFIGIIAAESFGHVQHIDAALPEKVAIVSGLVGIEATKPTYVVAENELNLGPSILACLDQCSESIAFFCCGARDRVIDERTIDEHLGRHPIDFSPNAQPLLASVTLALFALRLETHVLRRVAVAEQEHGLVALAHRC